MRGQDQETTEQDDCRRGRESSWTRRPYLFVVLEADRPLAAGARFALEACDEVVLARGKERSSVRELEQATRRLVLRLPGKALSGIHARIRREGDGWVIADAGSTNGTYVNGRRVQIERVSDGDVLEVGRVFLVFRTLPEPVNRASTDAELAASVPPPAAFATLLPSLGLRLEALLRVSASTITVVLTGETGTGKEVLASALHGLSRRAGPLVAVNCGTLTESLAESLLAGHTRGAFSGAISDAPGFVRSATQGTLLLDEVQDSSRTAQGALLRILQEREVTPIGRTRPQPIDVRFVATSPLPLEALVRDGRLRPDLCARLAGFTFVLTPLRERLEDMGLLVSALLRSMGVGERDRPRLAPELAFAFLTYHWPLNVRELEQTLRRGWLLAEDGTIDLACFHASPAQRPDRGFEQPPRSREDASAALGRSPPTAPKSRSLTLEEEALRRQVLDELRRARGNVAAVARTLGKAPMQVHRWMKRFRIDPSSFRDSARAPLSPLDPKGLSSN